MSAVFCDLLERSAKGRARRLFERIEGARRPATAPVLAIVSGPPGANQGEAVERLRERLTQKAPPPLVHRWDVAAAPSTEMVDRLLARLRDGVRDGGRPPDATYGRVAQNFNYANADEIRRRMPQRGLWWIVENAHLMGAAATETLCLLLDRASTGPPLTVLLTIPGPAQVRCGLGVANWEHIAPRLECLVTRGHVSTLTEWWHSGHDELSEAPLVPEEIARCARCPGLARALELHFRRFAPFDDALASNAVVHQRWAALHAAEHAGCAERMGRIAEGFAAKLEECVKGTWALSEEAIDLCQRLARRLRHRDESPRADAPPAPERKRVWQREGKGDGWLEVPVQAIYVELLGEPECVGREEWAPPGRRAAATTTMGGALGEVESTLGELGEGATPLPGILDTLREVLGRVAALRIEEPQPPGEISDPVKRLDRAAVLLIAQQFRGALPSQRESSRAVRRHLQVVRGIEARGPRDAYAHHLCMLGMHLFAAGSIARYAHPRVRDADGLLAQLWEGCADLARRWGKPLAEGGLLVARAYRRLHDGQLDGAVVDTMVAEALLRESGFVQYLDDALLLRAAAFLRRMDARLLRTLGELSAMPGEEPDLRSEAARWYIDARWPTGDMAEGARRAAPAPPPPERCALSMLGEAEIALHRACAEFWNSLQTGARDAVVKAIGALRRECAAVIQRALGDFAREGGASVTLAVLEPPLTAAEMWLCTRLPIADATFAEGAPLATSADPDCDRALGALFQCIREKVPELPAIVRPVHTRVRGAAALFGLALPEHGPAPGEGVGGGFGPWDGVYQVLWDAWACLLSLDPAAPEVGRCLLAVERLMACRAGALRGSARLLAALCDEFVRRFHPHLARHHAVPELPPPLRWSARRGGAPEEEGTLDDDVPSAALASRVFYFPRRILRSGLRRILERLAFALRAQVEVGGEGGRSFREFDARVFPVAPAPRMTERNTPFRHVVELTGMKAEARAWVCVEKCSALGPLTDHERALVEGAVRRTRAFLDVAARASWIDRTLTPIDGATTHEEFVSRTADVLRRLIPHAVGGFLLTREVPGEPYEEARFGFFSLGEGGFEGKVSLRRGALERAVSNADVITGRRPLMHVPRSRGSDLALLVKGLGEWRHHVVPVITPRPERDAGAILGVLVVFLPVEERVARPRLAGESLLLQLVALRIAGVLERQGLREIAKRTTGLADLGLHAVRAMVLERLRDVTSSDFALLLSCAGGHFAVQQIAPDEEQPGVRDALARDPAALRRAFEIAREHNVYPRSRQQRDELERDEALRRLAAVAGCVSAGALGAMMLIRLPSLDRVAVVFRRPPAEGYLRFHVNLVLVVAEAADLLVRGAEERAAILAFARGVSHQINGPLNIIEETAQGLEASLAGAGTEAWRAERARELKSIRVQEKWIRSTFRALLPRTAHPTPPSGALPLRESALLDGILERFPGLDREFDFTIEVPADLPPVCAPEHDGEIQVLHMLLIAVQNAQRAIHQRRATGGAIAVRAWREGDSVVLAVIDDGVGIRNDHIDRVTEPFFTTNMHAGGMGLGLYIARFLVEENFHGVLRVRSRRAEGEPKARESPGTQVEFVLPIAGPPGGPP